MMKRPDERDGDELRRILQRHDPAPPLSHISVTALEAKILARVRHAPQSHPFPQNQLLMWIFSRGWSMRAVAMAAMLAVISGFLVGQLTQGGARIPALGGSLPLLAFADETPWPSDTLGDASWGDSDDDAE